jgi:DNA helicase-2/ATP-dependent DNA helicase PcrA
MAISCAYCGGVHERAEQVRQCWIDGGQPELDLDVAPEPDPVPRDTVATRSTNRATSPATTDTYDTSDTSAGATRDTRRATRRGGGTEMVPRRVAPGRAGPDALGRHAIVAPGDEVPEPWRGAPRFTIDDDVLARPHRALDALRRASIERRRMVLELAADFEPEPMQAAGDEPFSLGARFTFDLETLHHFVWVNSIDLRTAPAWLALDRAIAAGCTPVEAGGAGDLVTADGTPMWLDAGPLTHFDPIDGVPVIHALAIEHGGTEAPLANESAAELAPDQLAAVTHDGGAARIVAPAGSGKTRVLTERARHLVQQWQLPPGAVTLVAFNKRAQEEMRERLSDVAGLQVRTLNSLALAIVNGTAPFEPQPRRWKTIDEPDVRRILGDLVKFPRRRNSDPVAPWIEALSLVRLGLLSPRDAEARYDGDVEGLPDVWPAFRERLERRGEVDFDDQIHRALLVLLGDPVARRTAQRACRLMLVDEFQDLTPAHILLIRLLASPAGAVFGVGDDDQTIYGYNGADPAWLIDFAELFPGAGDHPLEVNYRCPAGIVDAVDRLLRHNRRRVRKTIRADSDDGDGWSADTAVDPVAATVAAVRAALASGAAPGEIAVLTRVNAVLAPVQVALVVDGVPVSGGVGTEFLDRAAVRAALAWLRLARAATDERRRFDSDDLREALRRPSRSFHPRIGDWIAEQGSIVDLQRLAGRLNNERDAERLSEFAEDIRSLGSLVRDEATTSDVVLALIDEVGLAGSVATLDATRHGMNRGAQGDDLTAIAQLAALHDDPTTFEPWLREQLTVRRSTDGVTLATVHRVKGQEWPHVVVHLADADQYPHRLAEDVEEERRLFHVALTRAARDAIIVTGPDPSPFVDDLTNEPRPERVVTTHTPTSEQPGRRTAKPSDPTGDLDADAAARFEALRTLRNELRDGKPAYVVFDNKTLAAIAKQAPTTHAELARISGVGPAKLDRYGDAVTELMSRLLA